MKSLEDASVIGKRVLVRIDGDVPLSPGQHPKVTNDYRLQKMLPTIFYLMNHKAKIILCAHAGRPGGKVVSELSLKPVYTHLSALIGKKILFAPSLSTEAVNVSNKLEEGEILGIENLRFDKGEENNSRTFARKLANLADLYVNDSFATHHEAASINAVTEFLPSYAGMQLEREVETLTNLMKHPAKPFVAIIGGAKVDDKLPVIAKLLHSVDRVLLGGRPANTFLAAQGMDVKKSIVYPEYFDQAKAIFKRAKGRVILPVDFAWEDGMILDIGPKSTRLYLSYIKTAKTVLWSGPIGKFEDKKYARSSELIARQIASSAATSVAGGGNTLEMLDSFKLREKFSFVSTGGGAMLELLGGQTLPGVKALK